MIRKTLLAAALLLGSISPLFAHAHLAKSEPQDDATLKNAPPTISIEYTELLELNLSSLVLKDGKGKAIETGKLQHVNDNKKTLAIKPPVLSPGTYRVEWGAASVDTHRTEGSFTFKILP